MSKIYIVVDDDNKPIIAYSDYAEAKETAINMFGKSLNQLNKHCYSIPFCDNTKVVDFKNSKDIINLTIQATLSAYEKVADKFIEMYEGYRNVEEDISQ